MKGKSIVIIVLAVTVTLLGAGVALAAITGSKHDVSFTGTSSIKAAADEQNNEVCIWCHTPHSANQAAGPLWNKAAAGLGPASYTMYGTTIAGNSPSATPEAETQACLSCHDGVNAINALVNAQGTGGVNSAGQIVTFNLSATPALMPSTNPAYIGEDLSDDHPVSIVYTAGDAGLKATTDTLLGTWQGLPAGSAISAVLRGTPGRVECGSCHEPHSTVNSLFLRNPNANSQMCLSCHNK